MASESSATPATRHSHEPAHGPRVSTAVMFVHDLEASVSFYCDLLMMDVSVRDNSAALLVNANSAQLYLREMGPRASHALGSVGVQYVIWTASDADELRRCERVLGERCARVLKRTVDGIVFVEGKDPNDLPVVVTHPGPDSAARHMIMPRFYDW